MKKLSILFCAALLVGVVLLATPVAGASPFASPLPPAITETSSVKVPTEIYVYIDCANGGAGEGVLLTGNLHIQSHLTITPNGSYLLTSHYQPQGISGTGDASGDKYQATGGTHDRVRFSALPYNYTYVNNFRIVGQGKGNNFVVHENVHITINSQGVLTAYVDNYRAECK